MSGQTTQQEARDAAGQQAQVDAQRQADQRAKHAEQAAAEEFADKLAGATKKVTEIGAAIAGSIFALHRWTNSILNSRESLANEVGGPLAGIMNQLKVREFQLNIRLGQVLSPSTARFAQATFERDLAAQPYKEGLEKLNNEVGTAWMKFERGALRFGNFMYQWFTSPKGTTNQQIIDKIKAEEEELRKGTKSGGVDVIQKLEQALQEQSAKTKRRPLPRIQ